jgi:hypothetical protein
MTTPTPRLREALDAANTAARLIHRLTTDQQELADNLTETHRRLVTAREQFDVAYDALRSAMDPFAGLTRDAVGDYATGGVVGAGFVFVKYPDPPATGDQDGENTPAEGWDGSTDVMGEPVEGELIALAADVITIPTDLPPGLNVTIHRMTPDDGEYGA